MNHHCAWDFASFITMIFTFIAFLATAVHVLMYFRTFLRLRHKSISHVLEMLVSTVLTGGLFYIYCLMAQSMLNPEYRMVCASTSLIGYGFIICALFYLNYKLAKFNHAIEVDYIHQEEVYLNA